MFSIDSYFLSLIIIALANQFHVYLPWDQPSFSKVDSTFIQEKALVGSFSVNSVIVKTSPMNRLQLQFTQIPVYRRCTNCTYSYTNCHQCSAAPSTCPQSSSHTCDGLGNTAAVQLCMLETTGRWTIISISISSICAVI